MAAENYHLKWDSHLSYLNTSIATLYKNEKFADVVLYSSYTSSSINSDIPTVGISAHKFILSSCSQFFATMFETAPITSPNGVIYVVLPPDLSHRAIQILVQYMYSGEATVSNDILNEVLRGGEILKIRGLCRSSASNNSSTTVTSSHSHSHSHHHPHGGHLHQRESSASAMYVSNGSRSTLPPPPMSTQLPGGDLYSSKPSSSSSGSGRYTIKSPTLPPPPTNSTTLLGWPHQHHNHHHPHQQQQHQQQQFRGLGASVMPKDSPVIVKSPKMAAHTGLLSVASSSKLGISVNKEVAIDPEDKCCYAAASSQVEPQPPPPSSTTAGAVAGGGVGVGGVPPPPAMSICTEVGCSSCPLTVGTATEPAETTLRRPEYEEQALCDREDVGLVYERRLRRESACERAHEYYEAPLHFATPPPAPHPHSFLSIKQEPSDWSNNPPTAANASNNNHDEGEQLSPKQPLDFKMSAVKLELNRDRATPHEESEEHTLRDYNNFKQLQLLVCEICQKSFEDTKTLVRHLGTHANEPGSGTNHMAATASGSASTTSSNTNLAMRALKTYVPKKRRRVSENNMDHDHVTLLCDLCATSFETPAEWVRHMNSQHTEIELAMFNSKKDGEQKGQQQQQHPQQQPQQQQQQIPNSSTTNSSSSIGGSSSSTVSTSQMQPKFHSSSNRTTQSQIQPLILNKRSNVVATAVAASPTGLSSSHG
ncbi:uncharacterized protein LOC111069607 isoform X2 [Drosophila obscura]|uniref:uncharacterized protein LOC111069607 isoform X2 n=1 Tax=Drosophila obscura TaxID=7282 RepID=UPI001BB24CEC|nr:uncharacterized protein LOC111069607 isoform X2 [Drosophila obscura]